MRSIKEEQLSKRNISELFEGIVQALCQKSLKFYGERLISFVVFGSVGRQAMKPDSARTLYMTNKPLAQSYRIKAEKRLKILDVPSALFVSIKQDR
jgi:hypothetical protein